MGLDRGGRAGQVPTDLPDRDTQTAHRTTCVTRVCRPSSTPVPATQVAAWAGQSVEVLLRIYAKCIAGQEETAMLRIERALKIDIGGEDR